MTLSLNDGKKLRDALRPTLEPYYSHQGWPDLDHADAATAIILDLLQAIGCPLGHPVRQDALNALLGAEARAGIDTDAWRKGAPG
jgi:hypothetical protein